MKSKSFPEHVIKTFPLVGSKKIRKENKKENTRKNKIDKKNLYSTKASPRPKFILKTTIIKTKERPGKTTEAIKSESTSAKPQTAQQTIISMTTNPAFKSIKRMNVGEGDHNKKQNNRLPKTQH